MSKKNTPVQDEKQNKTSNQTTEPKKGNSPNSKPTSTASSDTSVPKSPASKPPAPKKEVAAALSPIEELIALIDKDSSLPKAWKTSFTRQIKSGKASDSELMRRDFRNAAIESHDKSREIAAVFQTEREDRREYRFLLSLAANTSGFDGKVREKLSDATLKGKREEFMDLLTAEVFKDQPHWGKIDESISNLV